MMREWIADIAAAVLLFGGIFPLCFILSVIAAEMMGKL